MVENSLTEWNRAKDFLAASKRNLEESDLKTAANRLYFACERAAVAGLRAANRKVPKHHKVVWMLSRYLGLGYDCYKLLRKLYDLRLQADYGKSSKIVELTTESLKEQIAEADKMFETIKNKFHMP